MAKSILGRRDSRQVESEGGLRQGVERDDEGCYSKHDVCGVEGGVVQRVAGIYYPFRRDASTVKAEYDT